jgi:hypothetical protein
VDRDNRIVAGDSARPDLGSWYAHLRPTAGYRSLAIVAGPLILIIQVVGWFLTLKSLLIAPRNLGGACFGLLFLGSIAAFGGYVFLDRIAPRRYLYVRSHSLRFRAEVMNFRWDSQIFALDRIRSLDYGGEDNLRARGLMVGYVVQEPYLQFRLLGDLSEDETLRLIEILRKCVSPKVDSALLHGARYAMPSVLRKSEKFVITPGIPLPAGATARPGYCGIESAEI